MPASTVSDRRIDAAVPRLSHERRRQPGCAGTSVHVARFDRAAFSLSVAAIDPPSTLVEWCATAGAAHAIVGGFYMRPGGPPLGELWIDGEALPSVPFDSPWHRRRACVHVEGDKLTLRAREKIEGPPRGDLLQAGPMLVREGQVSVRSRASTPRASRPGPGNSTPTSARAATPGRHSGWRDATWWRWSATGAPTMRRG